MSKGDFTALPCRLTGVVAVTAQSRHAFAPHMHDQYGVGHIHRGAQRSRSGRGMVEAAAGDTITVNPGEIHDGAPIGDEGRAWTIIYLEPELIARAAADITEGGIRTCEFELPSLRDAQVARHVRALLTAATGSNEACLEEALLSLLGALLSRKARAAHRDAPAWIARVRERIDDDPAANLTLANLAGGAGVSRFQLLRCFRSAVGFTPHAYLLQRRVQLARRLIAGGTALAEAAAMAGFADQSHMTRRFVRDFGIPPGAYAAAAA
jgi:AraC-like DNA-binding protein